MATFAQPQLSEDIRRQLDSESAGALVGYLADRLGYEGASTVTLEFRIERGALATTYLHRRLSAAGLEEAAPRLAV
jgi:hypothetical protein